MGSTYTWVNTVGEHLMAIIVYISSQGPVSPKSREHFGPNKAIVKLQSACFEKLIF